jgi:hypothetical protein
MKGDKNCRTECQSSDRVTQNTAYKWQEMKNRRGVVGDARIELISPTNHSYPHSTGRFSPTGFILNALDSNCCHRIASARIQLKTYPYTSILTCLWNDRHLL